MATKKTSPEAVQEELFEAEVTWFHVFRDMIENGDVAKMGPHAVATYLVIKAHTNFATGQAFPSIELISEKTGISSRQIKRELQTLEEFGYITKEKRGRTNVYTLREKVSIMDGQGRPTAVATWDYLPKGVTDAVADLKKVLVTGEFADAKIVHIERLQINMNHVEAGGVAINIGNVGDIDKYLRDLDDLPPRVREQAKDALIRKLTGGRRPPE